MDWKPMAGSSPSSWPSQNYTNAARGAGSPPGEGSEAEEFWAAVLGAVHYLAHSLKPEGGGGEAAEFFTTENSEYSEGEGKLNR